MTLDPSRHRVGSSASNGSQGDTRDMWSARQESRNEDF
jgi:hypothetical protein